MPKSTKHKQTCRLCKRTLVLTRRNWWVDNRYKTGWHTSCKRCMLRRMHGKARARAEDRYCVICGKLFYCVPDTARRYRLTCSHTCLRRLHSHSLLVRNGKRDHSWNYTLEGKLMTDVLPPSKTVLDDHLPEAASGLFDPFS